MRRITERPLRRDGSDVLLCGRAILVAGTQKQSKLLSAILARYTQPVWHVNAKETFRIVLSGKPRVGLPITNSRELSRVLALHVPTIYLKSGHDAVRAEEPGWGLSSKSRFSMAA
jgi:hypothetical protein